MRQNGVEPQPRDSAGLSLGGKPFPERQNTHIVFDPEIYHVRPDKEHIRAVRHSGADGLIILASGGLVKPAVAVSATMAVDIRGNRRRRAESIIKRVLKPTIGLIAKGRGHDHIGIKLRGARSLDSLINVIITRSRRRSLPVSSTAFDRLDKAGCPEDSLNSSSARSVKEVSLNRSRHTVNKRVHDQVVNVNR